MDEKKERVPSPLTMSLQALIASSGHTAAPRIDTFAAAAGAVQLERHRTGASTTDRITRSSALWTLMELDADIQAALRGSDISDEVLGDILSVAHVPARGRADAAGLHEDFAEALNEYLSSLPEARVVDLADVALAILRAARDGATGLLPERMRKIGGDLDKAIPAVERLVATGPEPTGPINAADFSATVRQVRERLGASARVTAGQIAASVQAAHPGYGQRTFEKVRLRPSVGERAATDDWLMRVRDLYDLQQVRTSTHELIDGRLMVLGLAELDASLADDLGVDGFLDVLRTEVELRPRPFAAEGPTRATRALVRPGYLTDAVASTVAVQDDIGVEADVDALARLMVDRDIEPPLSIGLFGDWGSGKSYFMRLMQQRVTQLSDRSPRAPERPGPYCTNVRQIPFNAWHYADDNLWASLLGRIFEGLGEPSAVSQIARDLVDRNKAPTGGVLNYMGKRRRAAEQQITEGKQEKQEAQARLDALRPEQEREVPVLRILAAADETVDPAIASAKARITEEFGPDAVEGARHADEAKWAIGRVAGDLQVLVSLLQGGRGPQRRAALAGGLLLFALVVALVAVAAVEPEWLKRFASAVAAVAVAMSVVVAGARAAQNAVRDEAGAAARLALAEAEDQRRTAEQKIAAGTSEIATLDAGGATSDYLVNRAAEFRSRQGLIALIREELDQLGGELMRADGATERVILYIDDLDRCGTRRVVQVLEAVHLLLAFPLFVVVVGVDARWLLNSLQHHYRTQFSGSLAAATPQQYLEKIFQIPFAIRPLDQAGLARLMGSMLPVASEPSAPHPPPSGDHEPTYADSKAMARQSATTRARQAAGSDAEPAPSRNDPLPDDVAAEVLRVTGAELAFASTLQPIVRSPRAAKRLVNLYRIVRTTAMRAGRGEQVVEDHRSILVMLAVLVGWPAYGAEMLSALQTNDRATSLSGLLEDEKAPDKDGARAALRRLVMSESDLDAIAPYRRWLPSVARFSFDVNASSWPGDIPVERGDTRGAAH